MQLFDEENYLHSSELAGKYLFSTEGHVLPVLKYSDSAHSALNHWLFPKKPLPADNTYAQQNPTVSVALQLLIRVLSSPLFKHFKKLSLHGNDEIWACHGKNDFTCNSVIVLSP